MLEGKEDIGNMRDFLGKISRELPINSIKQ